MSCFIVKLECLNDVCTLVKRYKPELMENMDENTFIKCLYQMNLDAYSERYNEDKEDITDLVFTFIESTRHDLTMLKNFHAYMYQCGEGDVSERKLYKDLEALVYELYNKFDRKYIMNSDTLEHPRKFMDSFKALMSYMNEHKIEERWGD